MFKPRGMPASDYEQWREVMKSQGVKSDLAEERTVIQAEPDLERVVLTRMMRLNETIQGIVAGLVAGVAIFVATNWLVLKGGPVVGPHLGLLNQFFIGYEVSFWGSLIGCGYGFVGGFLVGFSIARIYNWLVNLRERTFGSHL